MILLKVTRATNVWFVTIGFLIIGLHFENFVRNGCHDLTMLCLNLSDVAIITVKNVGYCCIIHDISKPEAIHLLENSVIDVCGYI